MRNIIITINTEDNSVKTNTKEVGVAGEKLQSKFIVDFKDEFVDGTATMEYELENGTKNSIALTKSDNSYTANVIDELTKEHGKTQFQVKIKQAETSAGVPIFKSQIFVLEVYRSINAGGE